MLRIAKTNYDPKKNIVYGDTSFEELNYFTYDNSKEYPVRIESIGITHPNKKYFIERQHADYYVLEYITSGIERYPCKICMTKFICQNLR